MLIVFEVRMLIVLKCVRASYYAVCFLPRKILNIFFLFYLRKFDYGGDVPVVSCVILCDDYKQICADEVHVFEVHVLIVCLRAFYYGVCFFPQKNLNNYFFFIFENLITLASLSNEEK